MKVTAAIALLSAIIIADVHSEPLLQPEALSDTKILPDDDGQLKTLTFLICTVEGAINRTVQSQWMLPGGDIVTEFDLGGRFMVTEEDGENEVELLLLIQQLSYHDAGFYICEIRDPASGQPSFASIELQLKVNLQANQTNITAHQGMSNVELACEMTAFVKRDEDICWSTGGQLITNATSKYAISFRDGAPEAAQSGGNVLVSGRVSVLTIFNPEESDSGTYTCTVQETDQAASMQLEVIVMTEDDSDTPETEEEGDSVPLVGIVVGVVAGTLVAVVGVILCVIGAAWRKHHLSNSGAGQQPKSHEQMQENPAYGIKL